MMGFIDCMVGGYYTNSMLPNYSIVGFGFGGGNQLLPLMHLDKRGKPWQQAYACCLSTFLRCGMLRFYMGFEIAFEICNAQT